MAQSQALEGTREELEQYLKHVPQQQRFRLIPLTPEAVGEAKQMHGAGQMVRKGMFPQLRDLTEEDFKAAEWYGDDNEALTEDNQAYR